MRIDHCGFAHVSFQWCFFVFPKVSWTCICLVAGGVAKPGNQGLISYINRAKSAADINWRYIGDAIPAFLTIAIMPFTYSIAYGLIAGIVSYMIINTTVWLIELATGGRIKPADKEYKDPWTYKIEGGILPPWLVRASKGKKDFWRPYDDLEHNKATGVDPATNAAMATATGTPFGPVNTTLDGREHYPAGSGAGGAAASNVHHATTTSDYDVKGAHGRTFRGGGSGSGSTSEEGEKVKI